MKILDLIKPSLVGQTIKVYQKQEYNSRSHKNGRPAHYFSYSLDSSPGPFLFNTVEPVELKIVDVVREFKDIAHGWIIKLDNGAELRGISCNTDLPIIKNT